MDNNRQFLTTTLLCLAMFFFLFYFNPFGGDARKPAGGNGAAVKSGDVNAFVPTGKTRKLVNLGSLDPSKAASKNGCLNVVFDTRGATVRRVEITQQDAKQRYVSRELNRKSGYFGYLELKPVAGGGSEIQVIPNGSPVNFATVSGGPAGTKVQVGDILESVDGQEAFGDREVDEYLEEAKLKPGKTVELSLKRPASGGKKAFTYTASVTLIGRPKLLLGPQFESTLKSGQVYPRTMELTVVKPGLATNWPELDKAMRLGNWAYQQGEDDKGRFLEFTYDIPIDSAGNPIIDPKRNPDFKPKKKLVEKKSEKKEPKKADDAKGSKKDSQQDGGEKDPADKGAAKKDPARKDALKGDADKETEKAKPAAEKAKQADQKVEEVKLPEVAGAIQVVKRYRLPQVATEEQSSRTAKGFHVELELEIRNKSKVKQELAYRIVGPTTTGVEGWWYQMKPHGDSLGIGKTAGARDLVVMASDGSYDFMGGPEINSTFRGDSEPIQFVSRDSGERYRRLKYVAVDTLYFTSALMFQPEGEQTDAKAYPLFHNGFTDPVTMPPTNATQRITDLSFRLYKTFELPADGDYRQNFTLFTGPKRPDLLQQYELNDTVTYGWFAMFSKPLGWLLHTFYYIFGNYGIAIILLTVLVRLAMLPISRKAVLNAQMMQLLAPEMKRIKEQFPNDLTKQSEAQRDLFRKYKYNPMGGCLVMFLQLPVFMGLYRGLNVDIELRDKALIPGIEWCSNLAAPDQLFDWSGYLWPIIAGEGVGYLGPYFNILPMITVGLFILQQKLFTPPPTDEQQAMMQKMMSFMMIFMGVMFFKVPSGLCLYLITSSFWGVAERQLLPKPKLSEQLVESIKSESGSSGAGTVLEGTVNQPGATKIDQQAKKELKDRDRDRKRRLKNRRNEN